MNMTRMLGSGDSAHFGMNEMDAPQAETHPLQTMHLLLQGRYLVSLAVAAAGILIGGALGYKFFPPLYACTGTIHIKPVLANPLFDKNGMMPMYESYVQTQVARLKESEGVLESALSSQQWLDQGPRGHNRSNLPSTMDSFRDHLNVVREGELIRVTFNEADKSTASDGVSAVINAYAAVGVDGADSPSKQLAQLETLRDDYQRRVQASYDKIDKVAGSEGAEGIKTQYSMQLAVTNQAKTEWELAKSALEMWAATHAVIATQPAGDANGTAAATQPAIAANPTPEEIARQDRSMAELLQERDVVQRDFSELSQHVGPANAAFMDDQRKLGVITQEINHRVAEWKPDLLATGATGILGETLNLKQMQAAETAAHKRYEESHEEVVRLAATVGSIRAIEDEQQQQRELLDRTKNQIEELAWRRHNPAESSNGRSLRHRSRITAFRLRRASVSAAACSVSA